VTNQFHCRKADLADIDALTELCLRSKQSNGYDVAFMAACAEELRVQESWILKDDFWVAEAASGDLAGCIRLENGSEAGSAELSTCFVAPEFQGQGVGHLLFEALLSRVREQNLTRVSLDADPNAEDFYARLGFRTIGRAPSGSIPGRFLPRMELELSSAQQGQTR